MRNKEQVTVVAKAIGGESPCKCKTIITNIYDGTSVTVFGKKMYGKHCLGECEGTFSTSSQKFSNFTSGLTGNRWFNAEGDGILLEEEEPNSDVDADSGASDTPITAPIMKAIPQYDTGLDMMDSRFQPLSPENNPNHADFDPSLEGSKDNLGRVRRSSAEWDAINQQSSGDMMAQGVSLRGLGSGTRTTTINGTQGKNTQGKNTQDGNTPIIIQQAGFGKMSYILIGGALLVAAIIYSRKGKRSEG